MLRLYTDGLSVSGKSAVVTLDANGLRMDTPWGTVFLDDRGFWFFLDPEPS